MRDDWNLPDHKELWFRGEDLSYRETRLRPQLYRPLPGHSLKPVDELLEIENKLHAEFTRCAGPLCDVRSDDDWDWYFLMQHHGVPTRILDWTDGALVGLHFAVHEKSPIKPAVFVLDPYWLNDEIIKKHDDRADMTSRWKLFCEKHPSSENDIDEWERLYLTADDEDLNDPLLATPKIPLLWDSPHITRRVAAQRSRFMIFGTEANWLSDLMNESGSRISTLEINVESIPNIRHELRDSGITESVIFPDLDGLGRELSQYWKDRLG
jgi:hypothetical protein